MDQLPVFDLSAALGSVGGKHALLQRAAQAFVRTYADVPARLQALERAGDSKGLADLAHTLKGSGALLGARALSEHAARLEQAQRDGQHALACALLPGLIQAFSAAHAALQALEQPLPASTDASLGPDQQRAALALLAALQPLLQNADYAAEATLAQLEMLLGASAHRAGLARLRQHFDDLDADAALTELADLRRQLGA